MRLIEGTGAEGGEVEGDEAVAERTKRGEDGVATFEHVGEVGGGYLDTGEVVVVAETEVADRWEKRAEAILCGLDTSESGLGERRSIRKACGEARRGGTIRRGQGKLMGEGTNGGFGQAELGERGTNTQFIECAEAGAVGGAAVVGVGPIDEEGEVLCGLAESGHHQALAGIATVGRVGGDGRFCKRVGFDLLPRYIKPFGQSTSIIDFGMALERGAQRKGNAREVTLTAKRGQSGEEYGAVDTTRVGESDTARGMGAEPIQQPSQVGGHGWVTRACAAVWAMAKASGSGMPALWAAARTLSYSG